MKELDIVNYVQNLRLSQFAHKLTMNGHQRWFVNKFQKYNLFTENEKLMEPIEEAEEKEAYRIQAGYEEGAYKTFDKQLDKLCLQESVDRRIIFELIGRKITPEGKF